MSQPLQKQQDPLIEEALKLNAQGKFNESADALLKLAKKVKTKDAKALLHLDAAKILYRHDASRAEKLAVEATKIAPEHPATWSYLTHFYYSKRKNKESLEAALRAIKLLKKPAEVVDLARHMLMLGECQHAIQFAKDAFEESGRDIMLASYTLRIALQCADWDLSESITAQLKKAYEDKENQVAIETPRTHLLWCDDEAVNIRVVGAYAKKVYTEKVKDIRKAYPDSNKRPIRIGYISSDFRNHATSLLALGMLRHHNKKRFMFFGYCASYDDGSALRREMLNRFHVARSISGLNDETAAKLIIKDQIDILVDLNGLTEGSRLGVLSWRPAPIQISYLGFPGTSGGRFVDYIIADDYTLPLGAEKNYPEKIIRIPPTYQINDYIARYLPPMANRQSVGLPQDKLIIGMFNNVNKINRDSWATWMKILTEVPEAILWVLDPGKPGQENLMKETKRLKVSADRVIFASKASQEDHLARLRCCDLNVDPWPYGGHTTTGDALFAGIPVISLEGKNFASRVSGGLLRASGLSELICTNIETYIAKAVELLKDPAKLKNIKTHLLQNRSKLYAFNAPLRTLQIEAAFLAAQDRADKNLPPEHITIQVTQKKKDPVA